MCTKHFGLPSFNTSGGFWWFQKNISEHLWKSECGHSDAMWMHTHLGVWDLQAWLWWRRVAANRLYVLGYSTLGSIPIFYFISSNSYYFFPQKFVQFVSFLSRLFQATLVYDNQLLCDDLHHEATECDWRQASKLLSGAHWHLDLPQYKAPTNVCLCSCKIEKNSTGFHQDNQHSRIIRNTRLSGTHQSDVSLSLVILWLRTLYARSDCACFDDIKHSVRHTGKELWVCF